MSLRSLDSTDGLSGFPTAKHPRIQANSRGVSGSAQLSVGNTNASSPIQHLTNDPHSSLVKQQSRASITNIAQDFMFRKDRLYKSVRHKLLTCHFSSDGKLLACAGTKGMVLLWDVPSRKPLPTTLEQPHIITDIRFQPNSTFFAAACFDKIYFCDSTNVSKAPVILKGHTWPVKSIDFSPKDPHILCSCDSQGEILIWDVNTCHTIFKLKGHGQDINSICWDPSHTRLASVSHESARVWASTFDGWKCVYSLPSDGHVYKSCLFHPLHPQLLIIGTYQYIQLWDISNGKKSKLFQSGCTGFVSALTCFTESGLVASTSRDSQAQLWTHLPK
ncbi:G-protein beta WD-40 repeat-containing protein [Artemisia annua]|uniref:G-protein beta WD-40 repeat-containing protein n=1 Tax=Artemisia annua TaxID=35608 RepID=A0A2U1NB79_ARTAN|nr:G-protein beta WD-40 repeat-containing protein [Artemisia annua]